MNDLDPLYQQLLDADFALNNALLIVRESPDNYGPFVEPVLEHILESIDSILKFNSFK